MELASLPLFLTVVGIVFLLIVVAAFFSCAETAFFASDRHKLRTEADAGKRGAQMVLEVLQHPEEFIGASLVGNNLANIGASALLTFAVSTFFASSGVGPAAAVAVSTSILTILIIVLAEILPKTVANAYPERVGTVLVRVFVPLIKLLAPVVTFLNAIVVGILKPFGYQADSVSTRELSTGELRTAVRYAADITGSVEHMLLTVLEIDKIKLENVMTPHSSLRGLDLTRSPEEMFKDAVTLFEDDLQLVVLYEGTLSNIRGTLGIQHLLSIMVGHDTLSSERLLKIAGEPYYVPETVRLHHQLNEFRRLGQMTALVVDEYGDVVGAVDQYDIAAEIVGHMEPEPLPIESVGEGRWAIPGTVSLRDINRELNWDLPTDRATTLSGLAVDNLGDIPEFPVSTIIDDRYVLEITEVSEKIIPRLHVFALELDVEDAAGTRTS